MKKALLILLALLVKTSSLGASYGAEDTIEQKLKDGRSVQLEISIKKAKMGLLIENPHRPFLCNWGAQYRRQIDAILQIEQVGFVPGNLFILEYQEAKAAIKKNEEKMETENQPEQWPQKLRSISSYLKKQKVDLELEIEIKTRQYDLLTKNPNRPFLCNWGGLYHRQIDALYQIEKLQLTPENPLYAKSILEYQEARTAIKENKEKLKNQFEQWPQQITEISDRIKNIRHSQLIIKSTPFNKRLMERFSLPHYNPAPYLSVDLGCDFPARSDQYRLNLPTAPILHPYNPMDASIENAYTAPAYTLNFKLPGYLSYFVPPDLHEQVKNMDLRNIDIFISVQDAPWKGVPLLLRPQPWLDPHCPFISNVPYNKQFTVLTGLFSFTPDSPKIVGQPQGGLKEEGGIVTHNGYNQENVVTYAQVVSSGNTLPIENLDLNKTQAVFSLTIHQGRLAIVKHILLNQADQILFEGILNISNDYLDLEKKLQANKLLFSWDNLANEFKI